VADAPRLCLPFGGGAASVDLLIDPRTPRDTASRYAPAMGKWLITLGVILVVAGLLWPLLERLGLGRLPGDISIQRDGFRFDFPVVTSLVVSVVLTLLLWIFRR
jgi:hypothetical protein